jgi:hypothetical protein
MVCTTIHYLPSGAVGVRFVLGPGGWVPWRRLGRRFSLALPQAGFCISLLAYELPLDLSLGAGNGSVSLSVVAGCADVSRSVMTDVTELVSIAFSGLSALSANCSLAPAKTSLRQADAYPCVGFLSVRSGRGITRTVTRRSLLKTHPPNPFHRVTPEEPHPSPILWDSSTIMRAAELARQRRKPRFGRIIRGAAAGRSLCSYICLVRRISRGNFYWGRSGIWSVAVTVEVRGVRPHSAGISFIPFHGNI